MSSYCFGKEIKNVVCIIYFILICLSCNVVPTLPIRKLEYCVIYYHLFSLNISYTQQNRLFHMIKIESGKTRKVDLASVSLFVNKFCKILVIVDGVLKFCERLVVQANLL